MGFRSAVTTCGAQQADAFQCPTLATFRRQSRPHILDSWTLVSRPRARPFHPVGTGCTRSSTTVIRQPARSPPRQSGSPQVNPRVQSRAIQKASVDLGKLDDWRRGRLSVEAETLAGMVAEFNRYNRRQCESKAWHSVSASFGRLRCQRSGIRNLGLV
jgi:hypothetical protein